MGVYNDPENIAADSPGKARSLRCHLWAECLAEASAQLGRKMLASSQLSV